MSTEIKREHLKIGSYWIDASNRLHIIHEIISYGTYPVKTKRRNNTMIGSYSYSGKSQIGSNNLVKKITIEENPEYFL